MAKASFHMRALRLTVDLARNPELRKPLEAAIGSALPGPGRLSGTDPIIAWEGPQDWLLLCRSVAINDLKSSLLTVADNEPVLVTTAGDGLVAFQVDAANAVRLFAGATCVDVSNEVFPIAACTITRFAQVRALILREIDYYTVITERQFASHINLWLARSMALADA